jgi:hypothetical protein
LKFDSKKLIAVVFSELKISFSEANSEEFTFILNGRAKENDVPTSFLDSIFTVPFILSSSLFKDANPDKVLTLTICGLWLKIPF